MQFIYRTKSNFAQGAWRNPAPRPFAWHQMIRLSAMVCACARSKAPNVLAGTRNWWQPTRTGVPTPSPQKSGIGERVTPGISFAAPRSLFMQTRNEIGSGTPHPPFPCTRGNLANQAISTLERQCCPFFWSRCPTKLISGHSRMRERSSPFGIGTFLMLEGSHVAAVYVLVLSRGGSVSLRCSHVLQAGKAKCGHPNRYLAAKLTPSDVKQRMTLCHCAKSLHLTKKGEETLGGAPVPIQKECIFFLRACYLGLCFPPGIREEIAASGRRSQWAQSLSLRRPEMRSLGAGVLFGSFGLLGGSQPSGSLAF